VDERPDADRREVSGPVPRDRPIERTDLPLGEADALRAILGEEARHARLQTPVRADHPTHQAVVREMLEPELVAGLPGCADHREAPRRAPIEEGALDRFVDLLGYA